MKKGGDKGVWEEKLRRILDRAEDPGFELLTEIEAILSRPATQQTLPASAEYLFDE